MLANQYMASSVRISIQSRLCLYVSYEHTVDVGNHKEYRVQEYKETRRSYHNTKH